MRLPVVVPVWAVHCCRPAPRVGERYVGPVRAVLDPEVAESVIDLDAVAVPMEDWDSGLDLCPVLLQADRLVAYHDSELPLRGPVRLHVGLVDGFHGDAHPSTPELAGTVRRVRLHEVRLRWDDDRQRYVEQPEHRLQDVESWPYLHLLGPANPDGEQVEFWEPTSVLMDLELDG